MQAEEIVQDDVRVVDRYAIHGELASGGMAAVHLGRLLGPVGFARTVAIKRLHTQYARDPEFVAMFLDEARLVARIKHPNVVPTLDVVTREGEIFLVMEYVHGLPVSRIMAELARRRERMPVNVAVAIVLGMLEGLHAAHEAKNEDGAPLGIVHRDVSPQNVLLGADGVARVLDFGIAKAVERIQTTEDGSFKGKLGYMPPDVLSGRPADRRADLWGAGVVFWELLTGRRLFLPSEAPHALIRTIVEKAIDPPSARGAASTPEIDAVVMRALEKDPDTRYQTAREMASALEAVAPPASSRVIGEWLVALLGSELEARSAEVARVERASRVDRPSVGTVRTLAFNKPSSASGAVPVDSSSTGPISISKDPSRPPFVQAIAFVVALSLSAALGYTGRKVFTQVKNAWVTRSAHASDSASAPPPPSASVISSASAEPPPAPSASASAPPAPSAAVSALPPAASATSAARPTARPLAVPPKSCNPPYTIGPPPDYIRKPKLECLPR